MPDVAMRCVTFEHGWSLLWECCLWHLRAACILFLNVLHSSFSRTCRFAPCAGVSVVFIECDAWAEDLCGSVVCGVCAMHTLNLEVFILFSHERVDLCRVLAFLLCLSNAMRDFCVRSSGSLNGCSISLCPWTTSEASWGEASWGVAVVSAIAFLSMDIVFGFRYI